MSPAGWNYTASVDQNIERVVNLAHGPPTFEQAVIATNQYDSTIPSEEPATVNDDENSVSKR